MNKYNYEKWLEGHSTRKSMMEKLERSLIPFNLFACIPLKNNKHSINGTINHCGNHYSYHAGYDYTNFGNDIYDVNISAIQLNDPWNNQLLCYDKFKVVMRGDEIITIYAKNESFFRNIIDMFNRQDIQGLNEHRSTYVNNLLARYIILNLIERNMTKMQILATFKSEKYGNVLFMAANANRTNMILYAFNKRSAIEMGKRYDGLARNLTIVYFLNQDFEHDGNSLHFYSEHTKIISIRTFYTSLRISDHERRDVERKVLTLAGLLYEEHIQWDKSIISRIVLNPPSKFAIDTIMYSRKKQRKIKSHPNQTLWHNKFYRTLLEDALNVIDEPLTQDSDIFHTLCASNMINAYINYCNRQKIYSRRQMNRMFMAKQQMFNIILSLIPNQDVSVKMSLIGEPAVYLQIKVNNQYFQFSFRGFNIHQIRRFRSSDIPTDGKYNGVSLQAIATALYQYSYLRRFSQPQMR